MPVEIEIIDKYLPFLPKDLRTEFSGYADCASFPKGTSLLHEGQYIKVIPVVLEGLVRVFTQVEDRELLLYYIKPSESCVMSFSAILNNFKSRIFANVEADSLILLLPSEKLLGWTRLYPSLNNQFFQLYNARYTDLIDTIQQLIFNRLDHRLLSYLRELSALRGTPALQIRHREIANDLGTAREVVTRTLRKLENEGSIRQSERGIEIL
jgi:CRP/FNR family transcriptional regulator